MILDPTRARILVVDDDPNIRRALRELLTARGHGVAEAASANDVARVARAAEPDAILLDLLLPDRSGVEVCRELREWYRGPIIVLSARGAERDKVEALDNGADDYVTKPFGVDELVARIRANLRRARSDAPTEILEIDGLCLDQARRLVTLDGDEVHLTPTEYEVLRLLMANAGRVVTRANLLRQVWGPTYEDAHETLRVFVAQLRRKLDGGARGPFIRTEPGVGYRFRDP